MPIQSLVSLRKCFLLGKGGSTDLCAHRHLGTKGRKAGLWLLGESTAFRMKQPSWEEMLTQGSGRWCTQCLNWAAECPRASDVRLYAYVFSSIEMTAFLLLPKLNEVWVRWGICRRSHLGSPDSSVGKESACNVGDLDSIPGLGRSLEKGTATHSSILACRIPWTV